MPRGDRCIDRQDGNDEEVLGVTSGYKYRYMCYKL